jgi:hypothetical protein
MRATRTRGDRGESRMLGLAVLENVQKISAVVDARAEQKYVRGVTDAVDDLHATAAAVRLVLWRNFGDRNP